MSYFQTVFKAYWKSWTLDAWSGHVWTLDAWTFGLWTPGFWTFGLWTFGLRTTGHLDFRRLNAWTLDACTLNVSTYRHKLDPEECLGMSSLSYSIFFKTMLVLTVISRPQSHWNFCTGVFQNFHYNCRTLKFYSVVANFHRFIFRKNFNSLLIKQIQRRI